MGSAKAPKAPDYAALASQQAQLDRQAANQTTNANRVNQIDPYGQTVWSQVGAGGRALTPEDLQWQKQDALRQLTERHNAAKASGNVAEETRTYNLIQSGDYGPGSSSDSGDGSRWTQTTTLTPERQAILDKQNARISELLTNFQTPSLKEASQNDIQNLLYGRLTQDYDKRFAQDEAAQRAQLANQGFQLGSEGYNTTLNDFTTQKNRAYGDAATQAALSSYDQLNKERSLNQSEYGQQMGYLSQLLGGAQAYSPPSYQPFAQATPYQSADQLGAAQAGYQANVGNTNAKNAQKGQTAGTVGTIATAAAVAF